MRAGPMSTRITIMAPTETQDSAGRLTTTWSTEVTTCWAQRENTTGRERWANEHVAVETPVNFRIRYRTDIDSTMRVEHNGQVFDIKSDPIDPDGRREALILACEEVQI